MATASSKESNEKSDVTSNPAATGADNKMRQSSGGSNYMSRYQNKWGYIFISPWLIGFAVFTFIPFVASFVLSLWEFQLSNPDDARFIGLANWQRLLFGDSLVWQSLGVTFLFAAISLPISLTVSLFLAMLLNSDNLRGRGMFRTLFYAPSMVPLVAAALIWSGVLNVQTGWVNRLIEAVTGYKATGLSGIRWLDQPELVYFAFTFIGLWGIGNAILIMLAGLQGVPTELYDASRVDGAGWWRRLWNVTLPMVSPVFFYNLVLGLLGAMRYFDVPFVLNGGNGYPEGATRFYMIYFYKQAFQFANMGYGAALAWFIFVIILVLTLIVFGTARHWVYYAGGD